MNTMTKVDHTTGFYQKMAELQEKLKKSEEERLKLEEKFVLMMKTCREEEEKRIRTLRERYEKFLEDDKKRRDRNERIIQTLDKIESRAAALSAKSERLKLLRKHYEAYLIRMYPLWKKQSGTAPEQSAPAVYDRHLPVGNEKSLPWFGSSSGLLMNNLPLATTQSSLSPEIDQLWLPPVLHRSAMYVNAKHPIEDKIVERKDTVVEPCSPVVEGALDNYLQRAAELLGVPVQELERTSEKYDEEKSIHTEQDTSRDLLNVSLSDDSILQEKEVEKITQGTVADAKERPIGKIMIKEEKQLPIEPDFQAGGDNLLAKLQTVQQSSKVDKHDILNRLVASNDNDNIVQDESSLRSKPQQIIPKNSTKSEDTMKTLHQVLSEANGTFANYNINDKHQENIDVFQENTVKENIGEVALDNNKENTDQVYEQHENIIEVNHVINGNIQLHDVCDQNVEITVSDLQHNTDNVSECPEMHQECSEKMDHLSYAVEQEANNELLEYSKIINQNESDLSHDMNNILHEHIGNQEHATQSFGTIKEEQESIHNFKNCDVAPHLGEEVVDSHNTGDSQQYIQEQYVDNNLVQHYVQYDNDNTEQYEQEQYAAEGEQLCEQYPEQNSNEQCLENPTQFTESHINNTEEYKEQYTVNQNDYQRQFITVEEQRDHPYDGNVEQYCTGDNTSLQQTYGENVDEDFTQAGTRFPESADSMQTLLHVETGYQLEDLGNTTTEFVTDDSNAPNDDNIEGECSVQQSMELVEAVTTSTKCDISNNQQGTISDDAQQEARECVQEDHIDKIKADESQHSKEENVTRNATTIISNISKIGTLEEDSEDSSAGFWNPLHHSTIPNVDELSPKAAVAMEDTSESSVDSRTDLAATKPSIQSMQQFHSLLGVPPELTGDSSVLSDQDEVEEQLAALVADPVSGGSAISASKFAHKLEEVQETRMDESENVGSSGTVIQPSPSKISVESAKGSTRTGLKKPLSLIKMLESDTESLNLDTGAPSNVDSEEFDFSTE